MKNLGEILDIFRRCSGLTIEYGGDGYFISSKFVGDFPEREVFDRFSLEDLGGMKAINGALVARGELAGVYNSQKRKWLLTGRTEGWVAIVLGSRLGL